MLERSASNARRTLGRAFFRSWESATKASRPKDHELFSQAGLQAPGSLPGPATSQPAAIVVGMSGRLQDLLGHRTEQAIETKVKVRIDHNMAPRVGTAELVADEIRFR